MRIRSLALIALASVEFITPRAEADTLPRYGCRLILTSEEDLRPSRIRWTRKIADACPVKTQGPTNSCWIHAAADFYTVLLRQQGFLSADDELSVPYYFAVSVQENLKTLARFPKRYKNPANLEKAWSAFELDGGGSLEFFRDLLLQYGLVPRREFREALKPGSSLISQWVTDDFVKRLKAFEARIKESPPETLPDLFREEFGNLEGTASLIRKDVSRRTLEPLLETKSFDHEPGRSLASLDRITKKLIDRGIAVQVDLNGNAKLDALIERAGYTELHSDAFQPQPEYAHAILVVGYKMNREGEITHYLLKNSAGESYGENGYFTADRVFMTHWLTAVYDVTGDALPSAQR